MKLGTTLVLCAASALGTAFVLDKVTNGMVRDSLFNRDNDLDDIFDDFDDEEKDDPRLYEANIEPEDEGIYALTRANTDENAKHDHVFMPIQDALNLYDMIEDAIGKIDPESQSDIKCFGDKAISFERLYDAIEDDITSRYTKDDTESVNNNPNNHTEDNPSRLDPESDNYNIINRVTF